MTEIIPTILTADIDDFSRKINLIRGVAPRVQIDFIDGKFTENKTVDFEAMEHLFTEADEGLKLKTDVHLMVKEPADWINRAMKILPDRIIGQVEMMSNPMDFINKVVEAGTEVGIALDLDTPISVVSDDIYHSVDLILVLAARAGFSGQEFQPQALKKIEELKKIVGDLVEIGVDCGLNDETIKQSLKAGASVFYVNHSFWQALYQNGTGQALKQSGSGQAENLAKRYNELLQLISKS